MKISLKLDLLSGLTIPEQEKAFITQNGLGVVLFALYVQALKSIYPQGLDYKQAVNVALAESFLNKPGIDQFEVKGLVWEILSCLKHQNARFFPEQAPILIRLVTAIEEQAKEQSK